MVSQLADGLSTHTFLRCPPTGRKLNQDGAQPLKVTVVHVTHVFQMDKIGNNRTDQKHCEHVVLKTAASQRVSEHADGKR